MSNSIWKKPTVRPVKDCIVVWQNPAHMSFTLPRTARKYMERYNCERWATLDDLIAQADKAERLEKENEAMRDEFELWHYNHKCVLEELESARQALKDHSADASKMVGQKGTTNDK